jgi:protein-arginine kinase activator protein McsA
METYRITEDGKAIICLLCGRTSYNFEDVRRLYCGNCHRFHDTIECAICHKPATVWTQTCEDHRPT